MRQEVRKSVNGKDYIFYQFGASEGLKVWFRILKIIGTPIGALASKATSGIKTDVREIGIDKAVEMLCQNIEADEVLTLIKDVLSQVTYEWKRLNDIFDVHFAGNYMQIFDVLYVSLEVNYKDFLLGIAEKAGLLPAK
jgi:hypothetical protein